MLALAKNTKNDPLDRKGPVPSAPVFTEYPWVHKMSEIPSVKAALSSSVKVSNTARRDMQRFMAEMRIKRALDT